MTFLNRSQRREMARGLRKQGRDVLVLRGGPMNGWTVKADAPVLRPNWGIGHVFLLAESAYRTEHPNDKTPWERLSVEVRTHYEAVGAAVFGVGHYAVKAGEASAVWEQNV